MGRDYPPENIEFKVIEKEKGERTVKAILTTPRDKLILDKGTENEREIQAYKIELGESNTILYETEKPGINPGSGKHYSENPHMIDLEEFNSVDSPEVTFHNIHKKEAISPQEYNTASIETNSGKPIKATLKLHQKNGTLLKERWYTKDFEVLEFENGIIKN